MQFIKKTILKYKVLTIHCYTIRKLTKILTFPTSKNNVKLVII